MDEGSNVLATNELFLLRRPLARAGGARVDDASVTRPRHVAQATLADVGGAAHERRAVRAAPSRPWLAPWRVGHTRAPVGPSPEPRGGHTASLIGKRTLSRRHEAARASLLSRRSFARVSGDKILIFGGGQLTLDGEEERWNEHDLPGATPTHQSLPPPPPGPRPLRWGCAEGLSPTPCAGLAWLDTSCWAYGDHTRDRGRGVCGALPEPSGNLPVGAPATTGEEPGARGGHTAHVIGHDGAVSLHIDHSWPPSLRGQRVGFTP